MPKIFSLGEVLLRLETERNEKSLDGFKSLTGGAAFNVCMGVSNLGNEASMVSVIPNNFIGNQIIRTIRANGADASNIIQTEGNQGIYFFERGFGKNPGTVSYNRAYSAFANKTNLLEELEFGTKGDILHITGISLLVSKTAYETAINIAQKSKNKGMLISFDFNYRSKMAGYDVARERYQTLLNLSDIIFATKRDFTAIFKEDASKTEREIFEELFTKYNLKYISHTTRYKVNSMDGLESIINTPTESVTSQVQYFEMIERIGGGDAFVIGVLDGIANNLKPIEIAKQANAIAILKQSIPGDFAPIGKEQLKEFINNYNSEVSR